MSKNESGDNQLLGLELTFEQFQKIDNIYLELEKLHHQEEYLKDDLKKTIENLEKEALEEYNLAQAEARRHIFLENVAKELEELRIQESELEKEIEKQVLAKIEDFFESGEYANFIENLINCVAKKGGFEIYIGNKAEMYLKNRNLFSKATKVENLVDEPSAFEIKQDVKTYYVGINQVKKILLEKSKLKILSDNE
jgi:hypothetical protein